MMRNYYKKIIIVFFITITLGGTLLLPQAAKAQEVVAEAGPSLFEQIIQTVSSGLSAASDYSIELKEYVLDPIASGLAKTIIHQLTASVVDWINNGFEGSPSFIQNPGAFLLDTADQITGDFLMQYGGPLTDLCTGFSIDIRLALAFKYHPNVRKKYACTLGTIIANTKNAAQNATLNGQRISSFMNGNFNQGGLPAFVSMTIEPQNNPYGAYLTADSELSVRVANAKMQKRDEVSNGKGFLSWRDPKCKADVATHNAQIQKDNQAKEKANEALSTADSPDGGYLESTNGQLDAVPTDVVEIGGQTQELKSITDCKIMTPGSTIQESLQNNLNGPLRELELADEIDEIVGALFSQLIKVTLQAGLGAVSGSSPSDSTSYIYKIQAEANSPEQQANQLTALRNDFLSSIEKYISDTLDFQGYKDQSYGLILDVKNAYDSAKACYEQKTTDPQAQNQIQTIDSKLNQDVLPLYNSLKTDTDKAEAMYSNLADLKTQAILAKTLAEFQVPAKTFSSMVRNQEVVSAADVVHAQQQLKEVQSSTSAWKTDAQTKLNECNGSPYETSGNMP